MREIEKTKSCTRTTGHNPAKSALAQPNASRPCDTLSRHRDLSQRVKHSSQDFV
jgi:hypothetical protein